MPCPAFALALPLRQSPLPSSLKNSFLPSSSAAPARSPSHRAQLQLSASAPASASATSKPSPRPWALAPAPVYTLITTSRELGRPNFNIATYVTPLSLGALPRFAASLLRTSLTYVNARQTGAMRLVLLPASHAALVDVFGRASGRDVDKLGVAEEMGFAVALCGRGVPFFEGVGYVDLDVEQWVDCDEHDMAVCGTVAVVEGRQGEVLTTGLLREMGILEKL